MDDIRLTAGQIAKLKETHRKQRDKRFADRIKAIVLLGTGWSVAQVAEALFAEVIHVIVDNTTYYKSRLVKEWLKTSRSKIHFLQCHSPKISTNYLPN